MTTQDAETYKLDELRKAYPLGTISLDTTHGRQWKRRMEQSETYFNRYSSDWETNRQLLCKFDKMVKDFGTYVAVAYPIIDNFIADMYFRNPDPYLQDKNGDADVGRIWSDVLRSVHQECDSEREIRDGLQDQAWASFGALGFTFVQTPENAGDQILLAPEVEGGAPIDSGQFVQPIDQKVVIRRISPWRIRWDPKGRRWDLEDHRYVAFDTFEYLGPLMRSLKSDADRARLMAYYNVRGTAFTVEDAEQNESAMNGWFETDPEFIRVCMRTIWSRPDHTVYRMPYGATFTFEPQPWDEEWARVDEFPLHYMPRKRIPEDKMNTEGFIGLADLALIRPHVEAINKAQGLLQDGLGRVLDVYMTAKGALAGMEMGKLEDAGRRWKILSVDLDAVKKYSDQLGSDKFTWDDVLHLLPTNKIEDMQHMAYIDHEFALIQQIIGQGPADRGGVADSVTATQSLGQQQGLARRMASNRNDAGRHYNAATRKAFIVLQQRRTLPLRYQTVTRFNEKVWNTIAEPKEAMRNIDLHFEYATGSEEARTREQEFALRERVATILLPVFQAQQNWRMVLKVAEDLIEPLNLLYARNYFDDQASTLVMQLLTLIRGIGVGKIGGAEVTADNERIVAMIPELIVQLAQALLTPTQLAQVEAQVQGTAAPEGGAQSGSLPAPPSPGEAAADAGARGSAAAGMQGGLSSVVQ